MRKLSLVCLLAAACSSSPNANADADPNAPDAPLPDADPQAPDAPPPDATLGPLPDLTLDGVTIANSIRIQPNRFFADGDCVIVEGCVTGPGSRKLLNFSTVTQNDGEAHLEVGDPNNPEISDLFDLTTCHGHPHFKDYAVYELVGELGVIAAGHKQAFCLMDTNQIDVSSPGNNYSCSFQGISKGWADTYGRSLDCQWIDITDVPAGDYTLRISINPERILPESNYDNNIFETPVTIP